jgi:hypothetical protein
MKRYFAVLLLLMPVVGFADDGKLAVVLNILSQDEQGQFKHREIRRLELATAPWQAQGYLFTDAHGKLVKLQLQPSRVIMAISGDTMYYWDSAKNQRHSMPISEGEQAAQQILIFRSLLQGQVTQLQESYDFVANMEGSHWTLQMQLKNDQDDQTAAFIEISGDLNVPKRHILIRQADNETSEYDIEKNAKETGEYRIEPLLQEAIGE